MVKLHRNHCVRSGAEVFRWMGGAFSIMQTDIGDTVLTYLASSLDTITTSTAFSGIGAPDHALLAVGAALQHHVQLPRQSACSPASGRAKVARSWHVFLILHIAGSRTLAMPGIALSGVC